MRAAKVEARLGASATAPVEVRLDSVQRADSVPQGVVRGEPPQLHQAGGDLKNSDLKNSDLKNSDLKTALSHSVALRTLDPTRAKNVTNISSLLMPKQKAIPTTLTTRGNAKLRCKQPQRKPMFYPTRRLQAGVFEVQLNV